MMKEEEATGETDGPAKPVTTTVGPWWLPWAGRGGSHGHGDPRFVFSLLQLFGS